MPAAVARAGDVEYHAASDAVKSGRFRVCGKTMIRRTIHYTGRVQGVGFRFTTCGIARRFSVTGYVKNLPDGRVEAVVEGAQPEIAAFEKAVLEDMSGFISDALQQESGATGEFQNFDIRY